MFAHSASRFRNQTTIPITWIQSIPNLDFMGQFRVMQEPAIACDSLLRLYLNRKQRGQSVALPANNLIEKHAGSLSFPHA